jgi:hypothetical protein
MACCSSEHHNRASRRQGSFASLSVGGDGLVADPAAYGASCSVAYYDDEDADDDLKQLLSHQLAGGHDRPSPEHEAAHARDSRKKPEGHCHSRGGQHACLEVGRSGILNLVSLAERCGGDVELVGVVVDSFCSQVEFRNCWRTCK